MIGRSILIVLFGFLSFFHRAVAQPDQYKFSHLTVNDGLSHNQVNCFFRDKKGFMWIGTLSGLNRYDGYSFKVFRNSVKDSTSLINNYINKLFEDPLGRVWVYTFYGTCVYEAATENFRRDIKSLLAEFGLPDGTITDIVNDHEGNYWFIHQTKGLFRYDPSHKTTTHVRAINNGKEITSFVEDIRGDFWIAYNNGIIEKLDGRNFSVISVDDQLASKYAGDLMSYKLRSDADGDLWISITNTNQGIYYLNTQTNRLTHVNQSSDKWRLNTDIIRDMEIGADGLVWVATDHGGLNLIDKKNEKVWYLFNDPLDDGSLSSNTTISLYKDYEGIVWIGTHKKGINFYHEGVNKFFVYRHQASKPNSLPYDDTNCFVEDDLGNIWIGTNGGGLIYFDRSKNTFKQYLNNPGDPNSLSSNVIVSLCLDHTKKLWIGTYYGGLDCYDGKKITHYRHDPEDSTSLSNDNVWEIIEDSKNNLWLGTLKGRVNVLDANRKSFRELAGEHGIYTDYVPELMEDREGNVWVGTGYGLTVIDKTMQHFEHMLGNARPGSLSNNSIMALFEDSRGLVWVGTQDGLNLYDKRTKKFRSFREEDGLPSNTILQILEDDNGNIWVSTSIGISNLIIQSDPGGDDFHPEFKNYDELDGLQGRQFNESSGMTTSKGELIFGGSNGFNLFKPEDIELNRNKPVIALVDFQVYNTSVAIGEEINGKVILENSITATNDVTLRYLDNVFSIEFAALSFFHPEKNMYRYKLKGFDKEWVETDGKSRKVTYTNLDPGTYEFVVTASNSDGFWNEQGRSLKITILPPFWKSKVAFAIYLIVILSALLLTRYLILKRERMKYRIDQERAEASRIHELDLLKIKFFTNVSHEFRTPLTLILAPIEKLIKQASHSLEKEQLHLIHRNAKRLLNLVNQLLDFRRMEVQEVKLNTSEGDIIMFVKEVAYSFSDLSEKNNIKFAFHSEVSSLEMFFDQNKIERILFNLISNAFKFTPEGGEVNVNLRLLETDSRSLEIVVSDTGIGIPAEKKDKIFERFFQSDLPPSIMNQGSGIGLSITKEFVKIHGGSIRVESEVDKGSRFIVVLPVREIRLRQEQAPVLTVADTIPLAANSEKKKPVVLLVEDNEDFRFYLKDNLKMQYQILEAQNGKTGWQQIISAIPDLIVSDIMMPEMNGIDLCRQVKNDPRTSHIPMILLTARSAEEQKMEGFESGADDYVIKPFNFEILQARIKNLIASRAAFQKTFQKTIAVKASEIKVSSLDEKLIEKAIKLVENNISDSDFSVENLSHELGMSRVHLYKKLISLTGKSPLEFIRTIRLQRAAQLLEKSQLTVAEVAYKVGFNNPKYFARYFKEQFNSLPSMYAASKKNGSNQ